MVGAANGEVRRRCKYAKGVRRGAQSAAVQQFGRCGWDDVDGTLSFASGQLASGRLRRVRRGKCRSTTPLTYKGEGELSRGVRDTLPKQVEAGL